MSNIGLIKMHYLIKLKYTIDRVNHQNIFLYLMNVFFLNKYWIIHNQHLRDNDIEKLKRISSSDLNPPTMTCLSSSEPVHSFSFIFLMSNLIYCVLYDHW